MFFGWNARVCRLRKKWDRIREKSLGRHEPLRSRALSRLDQVEQDLMLLEERHLNRMERARIAKTLEINLAEIGAMLKMKQEELQAEGVKNEAAQR
jgi:hypothetical protein